MYGYTVKCGIEWECGMVYFERRHGVLILLHIFCFPRLILFVLFYRNLPINLRNRDPVQYQNHPSPRTKTSIGVGDVPSVSPTDVNSTYTGCKSTTNPAVAPYKPDHGKTARPLGKSKGTIDSSTCTRPTHPSYWRITRKVQYPPPITSR